MADELRTRAYEEAFAAVREVVNRIDPIGLIAGGAPEDEYDPEVTDLVRLVVQRDPFDAADVDAIWCRWFGDDYAEVHNARSLPEQVRELHRLQARYAAKP